MTVKQAGCSIEVVFDTDSQAGETEQLLNQMEGMKELLHTYERSIERKDQIIANLTRGMQKQRQRFDMLHTFCDWKLRYNELKKEVSVYIAMVHNWSSGRAGPVYT